MGEAKSSKSFQCDKCQFVTKSKPSLKQHAKTIHESLKLLQCKKCHFMTKYKKSLQRHHNYIHEKESLQSYECDKCPYFTNHKHILIRHVKSFHHHLHKHICKVCNRGFGLKTHLLIHKCFKCKDCPFSSSQSHHLKRHRKIEHDIIRDYECTECKHAATSKQILEEHVKRIHFKIKDSKSASTAKSIKSHLLSVHLNSNKYSCVKCNYRGPRLQ